MGQQAVFKVGSSFPGGRPSVDCGGGWCACATCMHVCVHVRYVVCGVCVLCGVARSGAAGTYSCFSSLPSLSSMATLAHGEGHPIGRRGKGVDEGGEGCRLRPLAIGEAERRGRGTGEPLDTCAGVTPPI